MKSSKSWRFFLFRNVIIAYAVTLTIGGCSSFSTSNEFKGDPGAVLTGVPYFLPRGRIHIVGGTTSSSQTKVTTTTTPTDSSSSDSSSGKPNGQGTGQYAITITPVIEPDPKKLYYLKRNGNYLDDDNIIITVNSSNLLSTSNATSVDETANIVGQVVSLATSFRDANVNQASPTGSEEPTPFDVTFDPTNQDEVDAARSVISNSHLKLAPITCSPAHTHTLLRKDGTTPTTNGEGIAFRLPRIFTIKIDNVAQAAKFKLSAVQNVVLPDTSGEYLLDTSRMPFVTKTTQLGFTNGMLTSFSQSVPSPILGVLGIPKAIIQAVLPIPTSTPVQGTTASTKAK